MATTTISNGREGESCRRSMGGLVLIPMTVRPTRWEMPRRRSSARTAADARRPNCCAKASWRETRVMETGHLDDKRACNARHSSIPAAPAPTTRTFGGCVGALSKKVSNCAMEGARAAIGRVYTTNGGLRLLVSDGTDENGRERVQLPTFMER